MANAAASFVRHKRGERIKQHLAFPNAEDAFVDRVSALKHLKLTSSQDLFQRLFRRFRQIELVSRTDVCEAGESDSPAGFIADLSNGSEIDVADDGGFSQFAVLRVPSGDVIVGSRTSSKLRDLLDEMDGLVKQTDRICVLAGPLLGVANSDERKRPIRIVFDGIERMPRLCVVSLRREHGSNL